MPQRENLTLGAPAKGISDGNRHLEIKGQQSSYSLELCVLEETLARRWFLELPNDWDLRELPVFEGEREQPCQEAQFSIDCSVGSAFRLALLDILRD